MQYGISLKPFTHLIAMTDFIEIYDDALSAEFCQQLIQAFDASPHTTAGRTGGGVDTSKKISTDLY
ncbi:MAG TPA: hypothetical protein VLA40_11135, partial [Rheinheimera sp.]|nr:hypothetical protein [Rheinheimera sp.]